MSDSRADAMMAIDPSKPGPAPIDFKGEWDAVLVGHSQIAYQEAGFRVYLTEAQIDKLLASRMQARRVGLSHRAGVPLFYMKRDDDGELVLVRDVDGVITKGSFVNGMFEPH